MKQGRKGQAHLTEANLKWHIPNMRQKPAVASYSAYSTGATGQKDTKATGSMTGGWWFQLLPCNFEGAGKLLCSVR